jgi:hypothetical protein
MKNIWLPFLAATTARIEIIYISGHAGIHLNERGDTLTGVAEAFGELTSSEQ